MAIISYYFLMCTAFAVLLKTHCYNETEAEDLQAQIAALDEFINANMDTKVPPEFPKPEFNSSAFPNFQVFQELTQFSKSKLETAGICSACDVGIGYLLLQVRNYNSPEPDIARKVIFACEFFGIARSEVCNGLVERYTPTMYYIFKSRPRLTAPTFCGVMLQSYGCTTQDKSLDWSIDIPDYLNSLQASNQVTRNRAAPIKIVQLTDIHVDLLYEPYSNAECDNKILCCEGSYGRPLNKSKQAGYFGDDRKCDPPISALELALKDIAERHSDAQLFYMNGDIVPHDLWSTTKEDNAKTIQATSQMILKHFPTMQVIPVLGNHETHPVNFYSPEDEDVPEELSTRWIYNITYDAYKQWIPTDQKDLYLKSGNYAVEVNPKFRLLILNSNFCYGFNVWQMYEVKDPSKQLEWLTAELHKSEAHNQTVHIIGHVPPTHDECFRVWSKNFYALMLRYHSIVKGQFYGHTHFSELKVLFNKGEAINTLWIAPSLTAYDTNNFAYRVYFADPTDYQIMDYETWTFNLKEANQHPDVNPTWFPLYRATEAYDIPDLTPKSMGKFIDNMAANDTLFQQFYQHYHKIIHPHERKPCGLACKKQLLCGFIKSHYGDETECLRVYKPSR